jgi:acetyl-CoA carboxylase biotin carboxyl carrier protein
MTTDLEMLVARDGERLRLLSPGVGWFTGALPAGSVLVAGQPAGSLLTLGHTSTLIVPADAQGVVVSAPPGSSRSPVGFGDALYELGVARAVGAHGAIAGSAPKQENGARDESGRSGALVLRSPQTGRFYHRPSPGDPAFVSAGTIVEEGRPIGLIEVMKTFSHVPYIASGGLPKRARIVRMLAKDGEDVKQGAPLLEVESA